jgi:tetratricopeptide (TPR) repeat protein
MLAQLFMKLQITNTITSRLGLNTGIIITIILLSGCANKSGDRDFELASSYYFKGDYDKAEKKFRDALKKQLYKHTRQETYTALGNVFNEQEQFDSSFYITKRRCKLIQTMWKLLSI